MKINYIFCIKDNILCNYCVIVYVVDKINTLIIWYEFVVGTKADINYFKAGGVISPCYQLQLFNKALQFSAAKIW